MNKLKVNESVFESIKHTDEYGNEYWMARELGKILEYSEYRKFLPVINKAIITCKTSNQNIDNHFVQVSVMIKIAKGAQRKVLDYKLSRYACYLIAQNGDSRKKVIALAQTYFAIQTRKQELMEEEYKLLSEDEKRLKIRKEVKENNFDLNRTAIKSGVKDLARFHNAGYKGLYNGETANDIAKRKGLRYREDILDNMGSEELGANLFRITQTDAKLKRENVDNEYKADSIHFEVGKNVREAIIKNKSITPENLPTPISSLKELDNKKSSMKI